MADPPRRLRLSAILAVVGVVVLAVALWRSDPRQAWAQLRAVPARHVATVVALVLAAYALRFAKWHLFVRRLGLRVPLGRSAAVFLSGLLMVVTPAKLGEVWKSLALQETDGIPVSHSLAAVALERLTDALAIAALAVLAAATFGLAPWLAALALLAFLGCIALLRWRRPWLALLKRLRRRRPGSKAVGFLEAVYLHTHGLLALPVLTAGAAVGLAAWSLEGLALWVLLEGLGVDASPLWSVGVFAAGSLAGALSILPGGVGTAEAGMVALLVAGGVATSTALAATLLVRILTLGLGAALGGVCYTAWSSWRASRARDAGRPGP